MLLTETFSYQIGTIKTKNGNNMRVAYIDAKSSQDTYRYDIRSKIKEYGAKWEPNGKWWYWILGNNPEQVIRTQVQPCIEFLSTKEYTGGEPKRKVEDIINKLISKINNSSMPNIPGADSKEDIKNKLESFKNELVNITSSEEFKAKMEPIIKFRSANNYQYSFSNIILILIQDPKATLVKPGGHWKKYYNRQPKKGAKPIMLWLPNSYKDYSPEEKEELTLKFLKKKNVNNVKELKPADKEALDRKLNQGTANSFDLMPYWYDYRFTEQIPNTEDVLGNPNDIEWFDDSGDETPELIKHIDALIEVIQSQGISVSFVDDLNGARGVSKSGAIDILKNQPKNAGMFNTITHEFAHELLHQTYLKSKDEEMKDYFVGREEGRGKVEQQAELCAWIVLRYFGYDMPTNINYVGIWGLNQDNASKVFDSVSRTADYIVKKITQKENNQEDMFESKKIIKENEIPSGYEIAQMVGCGKIYRNSYNKQNSTKNTIKLNQDDLHEMVRRVVNNIIKENHF